MKDYKDNGLFRILTLPGFGVKTYAPETLNSNVCTPEPSLDGQAMNWFNFVSPNIDFVCLMYYAKIVDSVGNMNMPGYPATPNTTHPSAPLVYTLNTYWSKYKNNKPKYPMDPSKIMLGLSFKDTDNISTYITEDVLKRAHGGFTTWAYTGGVFSWETTPKWQSSPIPHCQFATSGGGGGSKCHGISETDCKSAGPPCMWGKTWSGGQCQCLDWKGVPC